MSPSEADEQQQDQQQYTTNDDDQQKAAELQARFRNNHTIPSTTTLEVVSSVQIDPGCHKYVLIRAQPPHSSSHDDEPQYIVTSRRGAHYHRDAAEPVLDQLVRAGYTDMEVTGGGRIDCQQQHKKMTIYGFSYGFGKADHAISREVVLEDERYRDFEVTISNEGY